MNRFKKKEQSMGSDVGSRKKAVCMKFTEIYYHPVDQNKKHNK